MAYDIGDIWDGKTSHDAPLFSNDGSLSVDKTVQAILVAGLPRDQLVLGVPLYGRVFYNVPSSAVGTDCTGNCGTGDTSIYIPRY